MMRKIQILLVLAVAWFFVGARAALASHVVSSDLMYVNIGPSMYLVQYVVVQDGNSPLGLQNLTLTYEAAGCHSGGSVTLQGAAFGTGITCPPFGSIDPYPALYSGNLTLPQQCDNWLLSITMNGRYPARNLQAQAGQNLYAEAMINNIVSETNSLPRFHSETFREILIGSQVNYEHRAIDLEGDSLVYEFVPPMRAKGTPATYAVGFSLADPVASAGTFAFDSVTGAMSFMPHGSLNELYAVAVKVTEYRKVNTVWLPLGFTHRNISFLMSPIRQGATPELRHTLQSVDSVFYVEAGKDNRIEFQTFDADLQDRLLVSSNVETVIPGASFTTTGGMRPVATLEWQPALSLVGSDFTFTVTISDDACPVPQSKVQSIRLRVAAPGTLTVLPKEHEVAALFIPNIITANNDGLNDAFEVRNLPADSKLFVYSRSGKLLFRENHYQNNWKAEGLENGHYFYELQTKEGRLIKKGWLEILK